MRRLLPVALLGAVVVAGCAPSRSEMASPVERALQERLSRNARWRGADADKDRAVDDNVAALLKQPLGMRGAVEVALVRNPAVQVAYESLGLAQADLVDAGLLDNPRLELSMGVHVDDPASTPEFGVGLEMPFLSVLFLAQRTSIAEARRDAARARVVDVVVGVAAAARRAFVDALVAEQLLTLALLDVDAAETAIVVLRANTAAGNQTPLDLAEEEARYQQALLGAADVERAARVAHAALADALGLVGSEAADLELVDTTDPKRPPSSSLAMLEKDAVANNLALTAARLDLDGAARALGYASAQRFLPDLDVGVDAEFGDHTMVGPAVGIGLPITNLGQGEILRRESAMRQSAALVQQQAVRLRARSRQAAVVVDVTLRRLEQIDTKLLPQQLVVVDEVERRLNGMLVFPTTLVSARRALFAAQKQRAQAFREAWHARIDVDQLIAGGLPGASLTTFSSMTSSMTPSSSTTAGHD